MADETEKKDDNDCDVSLTFPYVLSLREIDPKDNLYQ